MILDLVPDDAVRHPKFLGKLLDVLFADAVAANLLLNRFRRRQEFRGKGTVPLLVFGSASCH